MFNKFLKSSLSLVLVTALILTPTSSVLAANNSDDQNNAEIMAITSTESIEAAAAKKAKSLTTVYGVTSVQYALIDDGEIIVSNQVGYNNKASKTAPTADTKYGVASISKVFTTLAVLKLVDAGKVTLDTPVVNYLSEFKMEDERYKDITVRMLLNHSSGIMGSTLTNGMLLGDADTYSHDNLLDILSTQRLKADPGAFSVYSNDGFAVAELVIEKVSGMSFSKFIADNFTGPLGMTNTKMPTDSFKTSSFAGIYDAKDVKLPYETLCSIGAGGVISTAEDLCKLSTLFTESNDILPDNLIKSMANKEYARGQWSPEGDSVISYGLGWDSVNTYPFTDYGINALVKGGDSVYYHSSLIVLPDENLSVAVVSSGGSSAYNQILGQTILLDALKEKGRITKILPDKTFTAPVKMRIPENILAYQGYYGLSNASLKVTMDPAGTLTLASTGEGGIPQTLTYTGNNKFYVEDGSNYLSFIEQNGNTYIYGSGYSTLPLIGQTAGSYYQGQKLDPKELSPEIKKAWEPYLNKDYYTINEKYSSLLYLQSDGRTRLETAEGLPNYCGTSIISEDNMIKASLQIPGMYGRDLLDYKVIKDGKVTYLKSGSSLFISEDNIGTLSAKKTFKITIPKTGYAQFYNIGSKSAGKKITVTLPKKSSFTVYDKDGATVFSSYISGKNTVKLPKGGKIVFVGSKNANFKVSYK